jgi:hypothetical protein
MRLNRREFLVSKRSFYFLLRKKILKSKYIIIIVFLDKILNLFRNPGVKINGEKIKSIQFVELSSDLKLDRMSLFKNGTKLILTDISKKCLHICDLNGKYIESVNPQNSLQLPLVLFVLKKINEEIYVYDGEIKTVFLFDSNFKLKYKIGNNLKNSNFMNIDTENGINILYITHMFDNEITLWNTQNGTFITKISIDGPKDVKFNQNCLFVINQPEVKIDWEINRIIEITKGNSISIIDKNSLEIKRKIQFSDFYLPNSLHLTTDIHIYTIAYKLDNGLMSKNRHLFILDYEGNILKIFELKNISCFNDVIYLENKIIISGNSLNQNRLSIIQFE